MASTCAARRITYVVTLVLSSLLAVGAGYPRPLELHSLPPGASASRVAVLPQVSNRVHFVGDIDLNITNWGVLGSARRTMLDSCLMLPAPSFEFPAASGIEYLYWGAPWVGAVVNGDSVVTVGTDGWLGINELFPAAYPNGPIVERTTRPVLRARDRSLCADVYYSDDAVSEQDYVAVYYDTLTTGIFARNDPTDGRPHKPIGIEITQKSYSWSFNVAQGFIIMEFEIRNISPDSLHGVYVGMYMDHDVLHISNEGAGVIDDICGFLQTVPSTAGAQYLDTINTAWIADNDGDPHAAQYDATSPTGVSGIRVLRAPGSGLRFSFNWWVSNVDAPKDWGPNRANSRVEYPEGNLGTPYGDRAKYEMMSNGEMDYDQVESAMDHSIAGWLPPASSSSLAQDIADGFDTRYLLSFGPFELPPDSILPLTIALLAAKDFHTNPENFAKFDPYDPAPFYRGLGFENLALISQWAAWVYDVPGLDTDGDGYRGKFRVVEGDTVYYYGDGVPDYRNPPPPPEPDLRYATAEGRITIRWNGYRSETDPDPFSLRPDFEGYRVYMSRTGRDEDWVLLTQRDKRDFERFRWQAGTSRWKSDSPPFTLDSLHTIYDSLCVSRYGYPFDPDSFSVALPLQALLEEVLDSRDPSVLDTNLYYFAPYSANETGADQLYAEAVGRGQEVVGVIRRVNPNAPPDSIAVRDDGSDFRPFYEYEYVLDGLQSAEPIFLAVTTFDFGNAAVGLAPVESSPSANRVDVWPISSADAVETGHLKPGVYPNPYRLADDYFSAGWENPRGLEPDRERARKVTFYNVPDTCIVSIWSIDGDLIKRLEHRADPANSEASVVVWNLITRNTQAIKTGIYIYSVESRFGTDVGKLVIIK